MTSAVSSILSSIDRLSLSERQEVVLGLIEWEPDPELLIGLRPLELQALSECRLTVTEQTRLSELLDRNSDGALSSEESIELERLVEYTDQLTLLKTRARHTLRQLTAAWIDRRSFGFVPCGYYMLNIRLMRINDRTSQRQRLF
jgi:hypothetical protein